MLIALSCSGSGNINAGDSPMLPPDIQTRPELTGQQETQDRETGHLLWLYNLVFVDPANLEVEILPQRNITGHWNALSWLENSPCTDCFKLVNLEPSGSGTLLVDIEITHPFYNPNVTGFDVRGIAMFDASHTFPASDLTTSDRTVGDGELVNADGYTTLYNWTTEGCGPNGLEGYIKGKLATITPPNSLLNGYKRHISDDPDNTRNALYAADSVTVTYEIDMPDGPFVFGYAVDANWATPINKPVTDPMTDFQLSANCDEPWKIEIKDIPFGPFLTEEGGSTDLKIDVYDWQGSQSHDYPKVECPELFDGWITAEFDDFYVGYTRFIVVLENTKLASAGDYRCLVSVEDFENDTSPDWLDLTAYQLHPLNVKEVIPPKEGWVATWGDFYQTTSCNSIAFDSSGNTYSVGTFSHTIDFDPGPELDERTAAGWTDVFLVKFDKDGIYQWVITWGGTGSDYGPSIDIDSNENLYVAGTYNGTADFDPGAGEELRTSNGQGDAYLLKLSTGGIFQWVLTWGGYDDTLPEWSDTGKCVRISKADSIFVLGSCSSVTDFDPGPDVDEQIPPREWSIFLSKFDSEGNYQWARMWGAIATDFGVSAREHLAVDTNENTFITGAFIGTSDFDPGTGTDMHSANGMYDIFLSSFNSTGDFQWAHTWGGSGDDDWGLGVAVDSMNDVYSTGHFSGSADFNPGSGSDYHASQGETDVFLSKFTAAGEFQWAVTWGGDDSEHGYSIDVDYSDDILIGGRFQSTVDFDPGPQIEEHDPSGAFLSRFDSSGQFIWVRTWDQEPLGGFFYALTLATNNFDSIYITGRFFGNKVDFDPGPDNEFHHSLGYEDAFLMKLKSDGYW